MCRDLSEDLGSGPIATPGTKWSLPLTTMPVVSRSTIQLKGVVPMRDEATDFAGEKP
jgi:hypothetical protein